MESRMNEVFFSFFACSRRRRAARRPIKAYMSLSRAAPRWGGQRGRWNNHKIGIGCNPRRTGKATYNTALTDVHLILTVVFPQMEMFFYCPRYAVMKWSVRCLWRVLMRCGWVALLKALRLNGIVSSVYLIRLQICSTFNNILSPFDVVLWFKINCYCFRVSVEMYGGWSVLVVNYFYCGYKTGRCVVAKNSFSIQIENEQAINLNFDQWSKLNYKSERSLKRERTADWIYSLRSLWVNSLLKCYCHLCNRQY